MAYTSLSASHRRLALLVAVAVLFAAGRGAAAESVAIGGLARADALYSSGQFAAALERYKALPDPASLPVCAGIIRSHLKLQQVDEALATARQAVDAYPQSSLAHALLGLVLFRRGDMASAEDAFGRSLQLNPEEADALIGLADLYWAVSMRGSAYKLIVSAHKVAPDNPEVQKSWIALLRRKPRLQALEAYLASPKPDDEYTTGYLRRQLAFLKGSINQPIHACRPSITSQRAEVDLDRIMLDPRRIRGYSLKVKLNEKTSQLMLDTGASGFLIGSKLAEKAGVVKISDIELFGVGDEGSVGGYIGYVDKVRIGDIEFRDCLVRVSQKKSISAHQGIVGTDIFARNLVHLDLPAAKLRLEPLPRRPDQPAVSAEDDEAIEAKDDPTPGTVNAAFPELVPPPLDRYIAPEMQDWRRVFRFGHLLLLFAEAGDSARLPLFLIDTGAFQNILSTTLAREVSSIRPQEFSVRGVNGKVKQVFRADRADLVFGGIRQKDQDVVTIDLSDLSGRQGVEVGGILGFNTLRQLEIRIDYRDGLVKFIQKAQLQHLSP